MSSTRPPSSLRMMNAPSPDDPWSESPARRRLSPTDVQALPDFSESLGSEYRRGYTQWRSGHARGARGEPRGTLPGNQLRSTLPVNQPTPNDPWAEISPTPTRRGTPTLDDRAPASLRLNQGGHPSPDDPWAENQSPVRRKPPALPRVSALAVQALPDFSTALSPDYRQGYSNWRTGNARGAQGEPKASQRRTVAFPKALQCVSESDPWAEGE